MLRGCVPHAARKARVAAGEHRRPIAAPSSSIGSLTSSPREDFFRVRRHLGSSLPQDGALQGSDPDQSGPGLDDVRAIGSPMLRGPMTPTTHGRTAGHRFSADRLDPCHEPGVSRPVPTCCASPCARRFLAPRKLSPFQFLEGRMGLGTNPPPRSAYLPRTRPARRTEGASYERFAPSIDSGGKACLSGLRRSFSARHAQSNRLFL